jgi:predicted phosphodiesterase
MKAILPLLALLLAANAWARGADGTLDLIRTPNDGIPALATPGATFDADLAAKGELRLVAPDGSARPLAVQWAERPGKRFRATCTVPADLAPGGYALELAAERTDRNDRAVYVFASFPKAYSVVHLTDTHVGREGADETLRKLVQRVNDAKPGFVLITGDLTDQGTPEQFQLFLDILKTCAVPTFVCAGNHDRAGLNYEHFYGPEDYMFRFGLDGYIVFDTKDSVIASDLGSQDADLYRYRRAIRSCRWSIGASHRYDPGMNMRAQITLFVDDPLNYLLAGHEHRAYDGPIPWGNTRLILTPAAKDGALRVLLIDDRITVLGPKSED